MSKRLVSMAVSILVFFGGAVFAQLQNLGQKGPIYIEPGPKFKSRLHSTGEEVEIETETVFRLVCGSDHSKVSLDDLRQIAQQMKALDAAHPPRLPAMQNVAGGPPPKFDFVFNVTTSLPPGAAEALAEVEHYIEGQFSDPITVIVNFGFVSLPSGVLGATSSNYTNATYTTTRNGLISGMDPNDTIQLSLPAGSTIPVRYDGNLPTVTNENRVFITYANYNATIGTVSSSAASINFSSNFSWDFTPPTISSGAFCFRSVITHEILHALGFASGADFRTLDIEMLDLYRFQRSDGTIDANPDDLAEFAATARMVDINAPGTDDDVNSDLISVEFRMSDGDPNQASHFRAQNPGIYIMDPSIASGETFHPNYLRTGDSMMMDAIGWSYPLINDSCPEAAPTACNTVRYLDNSNVLAVPSPAFTCGSGGAHAGALWYSFVAEASSARISTCSSVASDTTLAVYDGSCGALVEIGCSEAARGCGPSDRHASLCVQNLVIGNTYYIQVASNTAATKGLIELRIQCSCDGACCMPPPETCIQATETDCVELFGGAYAGPEVTCLGDANADGIDDRCQSNLVQRSQIITPDQEDIASNYDWTDSAPTITVVDDFEADGRPITGLRWWGSALDIVPPDGWAISFHEPKVSGSPNASALAVYFCPASVVSALALPQPGCDAEPVTQYEANLFECCLLQANPDSRSSLVPASPNRFDADFCVPYELGIHALTGVWFTPPACTETPTAGQASADFWGWHSTSNETASHSALVAPLVIVGSDWTFGPFADALLTCGASNMSFELLTQEEASASSVVWENGGVDNSYFLVSQHEGQLSAAYTADDFIFTEPQSLSAVTWTMEENSSFTWNGRVHLEIYPDTGSLSPDESSGPTYSMNIPDDGGSVARVALGPGTFSAQRARYEITGLSLPLSAGHWWLSVSSGDTASPGLCFWMTSHREGVSPFFFGGETHRKSPGEGIPAYVPWSNFNAGIKYDVSFSLTAVRLLDCNCNGVPDDQDLPPFGASQDCNANSVPDECERDCNSNAAPDDCDILSAVSQDCQGNGIPDECDIFFGTSLDANQNGVPDECCFVFSPPAAPAGSVAKNRYLSFEGTNPGRNTAVRVKLVSLHHPDPPNLPQFPPMDYSAFEGQVRWVGPPAQYSDTESPPTFFTAAQLQCTPFFTDWSQVGRVEIFGREVVPSSTYHLQTLDDSCADNINDESGYSAPLVVTTARWGDVIAPFQLPSPDPLSQPNVVDIAAIIDTFTGVAGAPTKATVQLQPDAPNPATPVTISDVAVCVDGFKGRAYPYPGPQPCP